MSFIISESVNSGYPYCSSTPSLAPCMTEGLPVGIFQSDASNNDGYPYYLNVPTLAPPMSDPLSVGTFTALPNEYPVYQTLELVPQGICYGCKNLTTISVPPTVRRIKDYAFWDTGLSKVSIPEGCVYSEHSFPTECEITFYKG